ncbi:heparinase II/III family protein [Vibrio sp. E150_011]
MLNLERNHDFQVFLSPQDQTTSTLNPPSFNWPQSDYQHTYTIELEHVEKPLQWRWKDVRSPFRLPFLLVEGGYRWRLSKDTGALSEWFTFTIDQASTSYLPPSAQDIFKLCEHRDQFLMYFDEDINSVRIASWTAFDKLQATAEKVDIDAVTYPDHYRRGKEEGKRTAIANVRNWIDRDLVSLTLLYKIWGDEQSGDKARCLLLKLAQWSPEGPASLVRPLTWGDEVGLSLARNLYLAYHWLSPLMTDSEKAFVRPMLVRIAFQMEERLEQDQFQQFPGHSHTSRLPSYLGVAAMVLHKEFDQVVCERWLNYALMIYQSVLPFYGGEDGSWAEGPFYSSSYTKWHHPFFLSIERLSGFSFYNHPFYKNYSKFAKDFVATDDVIHPFGDGFWCKRDGAEWPGFFAQNPLRIYADRFGDTRTREMSLKLELDIETYALHLLDVIPTVSQINHANRPLNTTDIDLEYEKSVRGQFYGFAGLGKMMSPNMSVFYRASQFGNSSHRHADQGNFALMDNGLNVLTPSGSYGYRYGSAHHSEWTQTTQAHNLPLIAGVGQTLDDETATAKVINQQSGTGWSVVQLDLSNAYETVSRFIRTLVFVADKGVLVCDTLDLHKAAAVQWRLHSALSGDCVENQIQLMGKGYQYDINMLSHESVAPLLSHGYDMERSHTDVVVSDASEDICHAQWTLESKQQHHVLACCSKEAISTSLDVSGRIQVHVNQDTLELNHQTHELRVMQPFEKVG